MTTLVFYSEFDSFEEWSALLAPLLPGITLCCPEQVQDADSVHYALAWKPPTGFFAPYRNLKLLVNLGAGVDSLVGRDDLPAIPIIRLSDPNMARMMAGYVLFAVLRYARDIRCHYGIGALDDVLASSDILVVMLPLTPQTQGLLSAERLARLPQGCAFINVSRGAIVDQAALTQALRKGHIAEATLDVFDREPLPPEDPLWSMDNVLITPHLASVAIPASAAQQVAENILRITRGEPVLNQVFPERGY